MYNNYDISNPWMTQQTVNQPRNNTFQNYGYNQNLEVQRPNVLVGRIVNDISEVSPNDVPMNGNIAVFPKADGSSVYIKTWGNDGLIKTIEYVLHANETEAVPEHSSVSLNDINDKLDNLINMFSK